MSILRYALICLLLPAAVPAAEIDWDAVAEEATAMLREYIRIDTSNPPGREIAAARFFAEHFERAGVEHRILESEPGRASIIAWLPGGGGGRPIVLLNHLDTVPADPAEWTHPPPGAVIEDGYLYGRGTVDCKGLAVIEASAMLALAHSGERLERDVIFLGTAEEETGGALGAGWFAENHLDLLRDAEFMINEGGHARRLDDGALVYEVSAVEKTPFWLRLTASGPAGHGSTPQGIPAVERLVSALERVRSRSRALRVAPEVDSYYRALAKGEAGELAPRYANLAVALEDAAFREQFLSRPEDAALVQSTISMTVLQGSIKTNVVPPQASADLDCRLVPGETPEEFLADLRRLVDDEEIAIEVLLTFPPSASSIDTDLYRAIERVAATDGATVVPTVLRGFTDSHFFREKGITVYGFVPAILADEDSRRMHGVDERIPVAEIGPGTRRLVDILRELDRP